MSLTTEVVEPFLAEIDAAAGPGYSAVLYGSVVRGEHVAGFSDINLMLVLESLAPAVLLSLEPPFSAWVSRKRPPPLLMTRAEWRRAGDVFPVEITDMKTAYRVLRGADPVAEMSARRSDLRRALEREFRGKLNRLRQAFVPSERDPQSLGDIARHSIATIAVLYRGLLVLTGHPVPASFAEVLARAGEVAGFDAEILQEIAAHRADAGWKCPRERFEGYLSAVERTVTQVDELQLGAEE